jgi:hypothetical protein
MKSADLLPACENQVAIRAELFGADCCKGLGIEARGAAPVLALCRKLVEAGINRALAVEAYRRDILCLRIRSIGEGAGLRVATHGAGFESLPECTAGPPARQKADEASRPLKRGRRHEGGLGATKLQGRSRMGRHTLKRISKRNPRLVGKDVGYAGEQKRPRR